MRSRARSCTNCGWGSWRSFGEVPFTPYYGTVDATPLFLVLLGEYLQWTGDLDCFATLRPQVDAALDWLERCGDPDGDGLFEYASRASDGLVNQGWKDSYNAIVNADGSLARPPIALVEMQGYVFRAFRAVANVCRATGDGQRAALLERRATEVRDRFEESFWSPELGNYALALHGDPGSKHVAAVDASNQGQALWGGIVSRAHAGAVRDSIMDPDRLNAGWGVRTLSQAAAAYNPFDYQTGAVWPHDSAMVAVGLRSYGFDEEALEIFTGLYEAATRFDLYRLPELFAGFDRATYGRPVRYPVACSPQAWAAGSLPYLLTSVSGDCPGRLRPHAAHHPAAFTGVARLGRDQGADGRRQPRRPSLRTIRGPEPGGRDLQVARRASEDRVLKYPRARVRDPEASRRRNGGRSVRIAQIAPLAEPVPPELYGGTERVVSLLTEELVRRGHEVTLFASGDSETDARLVSVTREALRRDPEDVDPNIHLMLELGLVFERAHQFDVIHSHVDYYALPLARLVKTPVVTTLHGRLDLPGLRTIYGRYNTAPLVSISDNQRDPLPGCQLGRDGLQRNRPGELHLQREGRRLLRLRRPDLPREEHRGCDCHRSANRCAAADCGQGRPGRRRVPRVRDQAAHRRQAGRVPRRGR